MKNHMIFSITVTVIIVIAIATFLGKDGHAAEAPYASPGTSGGFIAVDSYPNRGTEDGYGIYFNKDLDGATLSELGRLKTEGYVMAKFSHKMPENNKPINIISGKRPDNLKFIGWATSNGDYDEIKLPVIARVLYLAKKRSNAIYFVVEVRFKEKAYMEGLSIGGGTAKYIGNESTATGGGIIGWASAENFIITQVTVKAYGGNKTIPPLPWENVKNVKVERKKIIDVKKEIASNESYKFEALPIFFDFDIDTPRSDQEETINKWVDFIIPNIDNFLNKGQQIEISGTADEKGSDTYNSGIGLRRSINTKNELTNRIVGRLNGHGKNHKETRLACNRLFKPKSGGENEPDFIEDYKNRRVDLIITEKNLTLKNMKKEEKQ